MKHIMLCLGLVAAVMLSSCVSSKKIIYFQGADEVYAEAQKISQQYQMKAKPSDNLFIKITCSNPELLQVFSQDIVMGSSGLNGGGMTASTNSSLNSTFGYTVDNDGFISLPQIGKIMVGGMTMEECGAVIEQAIIDAQLITDPKVTVRMMNAAVTVLGGVRSPGNIALSNERTSILDVIARAGDIADDGLKQNIKIFRELNGERIMFTIDLTDVEVFKSPAFYVQQNDLVYVQPNKSKNIKSSAFYTWLGAGSSILGITSTILSLVILAKNW